MDDDSSLPLPAPAPLPPFSAPSPALPAGGLRGDAPPWDPGPPLPPPPAPREPAWRGLDIVIVTVFTAFAGAVALVGAAMVWAILAQAEGWRGAGTQPFLSVPLLVVAQALGLGAGFLFAKSWIERIREAHFWEAIHWRWLPAGTVLAILAGGGATAILVQVAGRLLPMPPELPVDKLFNSQTAWMLAAYGILVAPFFEEFFFRGLIYPSLRATFRDGMTAAELDAWTPALRVLGLLGAALGAYWYYSQRLLDLPIGGLPLAGVAVAAILLVVPGVPLIAAGWILNALARLHEPELLSILLTGFLFGSIHGAQLGYAWAPVLMLSLVGVILTAVRAATKSLVASWVFHCAYNGTLFIGMFIVSKGFHDFSQLH